MSPRLAGRIVASVLFIATVGLVALALYRNAGGPDGAVDVGSGQEGIALTDRPVDTINGSDEAVSLTSLSVQTGRSVVPRHNPDSGALEFLLTYESLEPQLNGLLVLTDPVAWIVEGETVVLVEAEEAEVHWPSRDQEPESGTLRGGVEISVFMDADASRVSEEATRETMGEAGLALGMDSLNFSTVLMELTTGDSILVEGPGLEVMGTGLTVRVSELDRSLKMLRVSNFERVVYDPRAARAGQRERRAGEGNGGSRGGATESVVETEQRIDLYRLEFDGTVNLTDSVRSLEAERIDVWARLVDGALRDGAIARLEKDESASGSRAGGGDGRSGDREGGRVVRFTGSGPLEIRPIREVPQELARDDVFMRMQSPRANAVVAHDSRSGASVRCVTVDYGATTGRFSMLGLAGTGVTARLPGVFEAVVGRFDQDLTTGAGRFPGPGVIAFEDADGGVGRSVIRWQEGADFDLDLSRQPARVESVRLAGRVEAEHAGSKVTGAEADIALAQLADGSTAIDSITMRDGARLESEAYGELIAQEMTAWFVAETGLISRAEARGDVVAEGEEGRVRAGIITAEFDAMGEPTEITAKVGADALSREGYIAKGESIRVDLTERTADLVGGASVGLATEAYSQTVNGDRIVLDEVTQTAEVLGAGTAVYSTPERNDPTHDLLQIDWSDGMRFNNLSGQADFLGSCIVSAERHQAGGELERVVGRGSALTVHLTPYTPEGARRLLRVEIERDRVVDGRRRTAEMDFRQFEAERLAGLLNLRGPRIIYDAQVNRLIVPDAGTLLVDDRRLDEETADSDFPDVRGSTGFWWDDSLVLDVRDTAHDVTLSGRVRMVHRSRTNAERIEMECESLHAKLVQDRTSDGIDDGSLTLEEVRAEQAVYVRQGGMQLVADGMRFDGQTHRVVASAASGNRITILDLDQRGHFVAEEVQIDALTGEWRILRGSGVAAPQR